MKKLAALVLCLLLLPSAAFAQGARPVTIFVSGKSMQEEGQKAVIREDRTFLPLRAVTEELGYTVQWDQAKKEVTMTKGSEAVTMQIGAKSYRHNGNTEAMDVAPYLDKDRTYVPALYLGKATKLPVRWIADERIVTVGAYPQKDVAADKRIYVKEVDMSFALPADADVEIVYEVSDKEVAFFEKSNRDGGDGFLFSLSRAEHPMREWNYSPMLLGEKDGLYYGVDFRGDPHMAKSEALQKKYEKATAKIDDILMTVRVGK